MDGEPGLRHQQLCRQRGAADQESGHPDALTSKLTSEIVTKIDIKGRTDQAAAELSQKGFTRIGGLVKGVSGSLASGVQGFVHSRIHKIITGPRMANAWVQVNRVASQQLVAVLSGRGGKNGALGVSNGQVTLDLAPLEAVAKQDLVARGLTIAAKIPIVHATFPLFPSKNLTKAQGLYRLINDVKIVLPILTLVLLGLGVLAARGHRRALIGAALGFAASMLVLGAGLAIARAIYLNSLPAQCARGRGRRRLRHPGPVHQDRASHPARGRPDRGRRSVLHRAVRRSGRHPLGVFIRPRPGLRRSGESAGLSTGPAGAWTYAHRHALRIGAVALAAVIFVFQGQPTAVVTVVIAALLLVALGVIELIGRPPPQRVPAPAHGRDGRALPGQPDQGQRP